MDFIGYDLGKVSSQVCIITDGGELIERRIRTDREHIHELPDVLLGSAQLSWLAVEDLQHVGPLGPAIGQPELE